jgi:RND family efflux transporter MFP subunit
MSSHAEVGPTPAKVQPAKRSGVWLIPVLLVVLVAGIAAFWWMTQGHKQASATEQGEGPAAETTSETESTTLRVEVVRPTKGGMEKKTTQPCYVHSFEYANLYAKISGYLVKQKVDIGDRVRKDDLLAEIYDPEVIKDVDKAKADVKQAEAEVEQARSAIKRAEADQKAAEAAVKKAQSDIEMYVATRKYRDKEYKRIYALYQERAVDEKLVDEEIDRRDSAHAAEHSAEATVVLAQSQVSAAAAKVDQAKADLAAAEAKVQVTKEKLAQSEVWADYTRITSPYDGAVTRRTFHVGDFIQAATSREGEPLLTVARTDKMRVVVQVPDTDVPFLDRGDPATVRIATLGNREFRGNIARKADAEDPTTRTMRAEVDLENPDGKLSEGMYGGMTIELQPATDAFTIPSQCLVGRAQGGMGKVYVVRDGKAHEAQVKIGADDGLHAEILEGLKADDQVILPTSGNVTEGEPVVATAAEPEASSNTQ